MLHKTLKALGLIFFEAPFYFGVLCYVEASHNLDTRAKTGRVIQYEFMRIFGGKQAYIYESSLLYDQLFRQYISLLLTQSPAEAMT